ncbi:MAG: ATP-binding protein [Acidobacteriota bacterium]
MADDAIPTCEFESEKLILRLDLTISGDVSGIDPVIRRVMGIIREMGCAAGKETDVEIALREALVNAVVHGCRSDPAKKVQLCVACDESRGMLIIVRDPGEGFRPDKLPSPTLGQNLYSSHGRGIYLINRLMDEVRFERGGTEIRMKKI